MNQTEKIYSKKMSGRIPDDNDYTEVCITGHIVEMKTMKRVSGNLNKFRKVDKYHYLNLETGKVLEYRLKEGCKNRQKDKNPSFDYLRKLINFNFQGKPCELYVVLTYRETMTDKGQMSKDFRNFWGKFKYHYPACEYIAVSEPQQSGSWHKHALIKDLTGKGLYVPKNELESYWQKGLVWANHIFNNDNIGAYYTALHKNLDVFEKDSQANERKLIVKSARLKFYPSYGKLYTASKGIERPVILKMTYQEAMELVNYSRPCFSKTTAIILNDGKMEQEVNRIYYQQFNSKR